MNPPRKSRRTTAAEEQLRDLSPPGEPSWQPGPTPGRMTITGRVQSTQLARALAEDVLMILGKHQVPGDLLVLGRTVTLRLPRPKTGRRGEATRRAAQQLAFNVQFFVRPSKPRPSAANPEIHFSSPEPEALSRTPDSVRQP